jgi:hypothetical protein
VRESLSGGESRGGADAEAEADGDAWFKKKKKNVFFSARHRRASVALSSRGARVLFGYIDPV